MQNYRLFVVVEKAFGKSWQQHQRIYSYNAVSSPLKRRGDLWLFVTVQMSQICLTYHVFQHLFNKKGYNIPKQSSWYFDKLLTLFALGVTIYNTKGSAVAKLH